MNALIAALHYIVSEALTDALSPRFSPERDLAVLAAMARELPEYLPSDVLYWRMQAPATFPMLTLGGLLLRLHRLDALRGQLTDAQRAALDDARAAYDRLAAERAVRVGQKMRQELRARLRLLGDYVAELQDGIADRGHWPHEAETRTMVQLLLDAARPLADLADLDERTALVDNQLRRYMVSGRFVAPQALEAAYARETFWWMYVTPRKMTG